MLATNLFQELDRLNASFNLFSNEYENRYFHDGDYPLTNVVEEDNEFKVYSLLPGVDSKDVDITYENGVLTLSGERKGDTGEENNVLSQERSFGKFRKKLKVKVPVDVEKITALYKNGVLDIILKKA